MPQKAACLWQVSSRKVLQALVASFNVPADAFGAVCIVVDKLDKLPADKVSCSPCTRRCLSLAQPFLRE